MILDFITNEQRRYLGLERERHDEESPIGTSRKRCVVW